MVTTRRGSTSSATATPAAARADNRSVSSTTTARRDKLPDLLLKQVAIDIETLKKGNKRGIAVLRSEGKREHLLSTLLDKRLAIDEGELYGERGDPIRGHITKYVSRWKTYATTICQEGRQRSYE